MTTRYFQSHQVGSQYDDLKKGSEIVYNIARPPSVPSKETDVTLYQYALTQHPTNTGDWIASIGDEPVPINAIVKSQSQGGPQIPGWQAFFGGVEGNTKKAIISGNVSGVINAQDFTRTQWLEFTYEQLQVAGWFS
jgi:hypothetical protein